MKRTIHFRLNGEPVHAEVESSWSLLTLVRECFDLTGAKEGCGRGECGACTMLVNGSAVNSCIILALEAEGSEIVTIEGLSPPDGELSPLQMAFVEKGAIQCGFCTPGMILAATAFLEQEPDPTEEATKRAIAGNFCRCTGYVKIIEAIKSASGEREKGGNSSPPQEHLTG